MLSTVSRLIQQVRRYRLIMRWLLGDCFSRYWRTITLLFLGDGMAIASQIGAIGLLFLYAQHLETGDPIAFLDHAWDPRTSFALLVMISGAILCLFIAGSLLRYAVRSGTIRLVRRYEEFCSKRVVVTLSHLPTDALHKSAVPSDRQNIQRIMLQDSRFCALALRRLLNNLIPTLTLCVAGVALLYLSPLLFLLITLLLAIAGRWMFRISIQAADISKSFEGSAKSAAIERLALVERGLHSPTEIAYQDNEFDQAYVSGKTRDFLNAFEGRYRVIEQSKLVNNILMALANITAVGVIGWNVINGYQGWSIIVVYFVVLRYCMSSIQQVTASLTSVNRFYPQITRYVRVIGSAAPYGEERSFAVTDGFLVTAPPLHQRNAAAVLAPGSPVGLLSPEPPNRFTAGVLIGALECDSGADSGAAVEILQRSRTVSLTFQPGAATLRQAFGIASDIGTAEIAAVFDDAGLSEVGEMTLAGGLDSTLPDFDDDKDQRIAMAVLGMTAAALSTAQVVIVEGRGLGQLARRARDFLLDRLTPKNVFVLLRIEDERLPTERIETVLISDSDKIVGWAPSAWYLDNLDKVRKTVGGAAGRPAAAAPDDLDDPDLLLGG